MNSEERSVGAPAHPRISARAVQVAVVGIIVATTLTSCRSGIESATDPSQIVAPSASDATNPTSPEPSVEPTVIPSPTTMPVGSITIITLGIMDGALQATGILPQDVDTGGVCTLTISRDGVMRSASVGATAGRESTYCGVVDVAVGGLQPGDWKAVLSYLSPTSSAESAPMQVQLP